MTKEESCGFCDGYHEPVRFESECILLKARRDFAAAIAVRDKILRIRKEASTPAVDERGRKVHLRHDSRESGILKEALARLDDALADSEAYVRLIHADLEAAHAAAEAAVQRDRVDSEKLKEEP